MIKCEERYESIVKLKPQGSATCGLTRNYLHFSYHLIKFTQFCFMFHQNYGELLKISSFSLRFIDIKPCFDLFSPIFSVLFIINSLNSFLICDLALCVLQTHRMFKLTSSKLPLAFRIVYYYYYCILTWVHVHDH